MSRSEHLPIYKASYDLCLYIEQPVRGSHHVFRHPAVAERINLQEDGGMAKVYQVRQIRGILRQSGLAGDVAGENR
jgi:predicted RNA binding protein YcfA (HicA-like mRNA interferase family)